MSATVMTSVFQHGGRASRYGEFTVVHMHGCSFITTPMEFMQMQNWARGRMSTGNPVRDRTSFTDRFDTLLARVGSGLATKGSKLSLSRIVKAMTANAVFLEEWMVPHDLSQSMEMGKRKPATPVVGKAPEAAKAAANEPLPAGPTPAATK
jgi:hypothetical protein